MKKARFYFFLLFLCLFIDTAFANKKTGSQNSFLFSIENIRNDLKWFTQDPHPMNSEQQIQISQGLERRIKKYNLQVFSQNFSASIPSTDVKVRLINGRGQNIIGLRRGTDNCTVVLGSHYDTKYFANFRFVGANDGGSSTVLLLEIARLIEHKTFKMGSLGACDIAFVFFDGEESFLPDWNDGKKIFQKQDNLYGSRSFVQAFVEKKQKFIEKPIVLSVILDMIGHKNQNLSITKGSSSFYTQRLIEISKGAVIIKPVNFSVEDDHLPFLENSIPTVHIIDWTNLKEWHTKNDTLEIIDIYGIEKLALILLDFLSIKRLNRN